jgi:hypothetical protein
MILGAVIAIYEVGFAFALYRISSHDPSMVGTRHSAVSSDAPQKIKGVAGGQLTKLCSKS